MSAPDILPIERLDSMTLAQGCHEDRSGDLCAMEIVAWLAGEPHSDCPACVSPVIAVFMQAWNDTLPDADRTRILRPLLPTLIGTATTDADERVRTCLATDWLIRVFTPAWLDAAGLSGNAAALRTLPGIATTADVIGAQPVLDCARRSAAAARAAAWDAASAAAWDAASAAAWDAAWAAARDAAWAAAWAAASAAARAAARDATSAAAWDAAWAALTPTVRALQASAADLVLRMAAVVRS